jgi:hypothetical protein
MQRKYVLQRNHIPLKNIKKLAYIISSVVTPDWTIAYSKDGEVPINLVVDQQFIFPLKH